MEYTDEEKEMNIAQREYELELIGYYENNCEKPNLFCTGFVQVSAAADFLDSYAKELVLSVTDDDLKSAGIEQIAQDVAGKGFTAASVRSGEKGIELKQIDL